MRRPPPPLATVGGHQPDHHLHHRHPLVTAHHQLHRVAGGLLHLPASLLHSEMLDQVGGPQVESYLVGPVVHTIDTRFRTIADRAGRAVGGVSSGGYGALNLGLRNQDTYSVIVSLMPYGDPGAVTRTLLGGSRALWLANAPADYIPTMAFHRPIAVDLVAGSHDPVRQEAGRLTRVLQARGQQAVFTEVPGATHTWRGARAEAASALAFASSHLAGARPRVSLAADRARPPRVSPAGEQARLQYPAAGSLADRPRFPRVTA